MNPSQTQLLQRLQTYSLDQSGTQFTLSQRLARENCWSVAYTRRVIEEYKKFAFLAVVAGHPVTPSDQVDQVWHLHLTYTRSYWETFCLQILQTPLHHEPTQGGETEDNKFNDWYGRTLASYQQFFNAAPPVDIWPTPADRFSPNLEFVRINLQHSWLLPKPTFNPPIKSYPSRFRQLWRKLFRKPTTALSP
ncbi:MAG: hypothetical protein AAGA83_06955 [Cyanobacteria bacterium P01_F01_bin.116]